MTTAAFLLYAAAAIGLSISPGPNSLLVLSHGALHGSRRTLFTIAGGAAGFLAVIALSMAGVGALLAAMSDALFALKLIGGAYLVWLGIQLWRAPPITLDPLRAAGGARDVQLFRAGLLTAVSNPKALLFYGAFLPQLIDARRDLLPQFLWIAVIFVTVEIVVEILLAALATQIRPALERLGRRFNKVCGSLFVAMGVSLPLTR